MHKERLIALATFLDTVPEHKFDITQWRNSPRRSGVEWSDNLLNDMSCGTTGCAVGWACAMPVFQIQGLQWDQLYLMPIYEKSGEYTHSNWEAVEKFFDISEDQTADLFSPDCSYELTPKDVASNIRNMVEDHNESH